MKAFCVWYNVHVYLSIEPVTLGSYKYSLMSFTSQLTTKLCKAFANSSVSPGLNHLLSHMQATSEAWGVVLLLIGCMVGPPACGLVPRLSPSLVSNLDQVGDNRSPLGKPSCIQDRRYATNPSSGGP